MSKSFSCPNCGMKQEFKHLFTLSNASRWECLSCGTLLRAEKMSPYSTIIGFLASGIPAYYLLFVEHVPFGLGIGVGALSGFLCYFFSLLYFYFSIKLEEADF